MKKFNLKKAKEGNPVCNELGEDVRIICFDRSCASPLVGLVAQSKKYESLGYYNLKGEDTYTRTGYNLFMKESKKKKNDKDFEQARQTILETILLDSTMEGEVDLY